MDEILVLFIALLVISVIWIAVSIGTYEKSVPKLHHYSGCVLVYSLFMTSISMIISLSYIEMMNILFIFLALLLSSGVLYWCSYPKSNVDFFHEHFAFGSLVLFALIPRNKKELKEVIVVFFITYSISAILLLYSDQYAIDPIVLQQHLLLSLLGLVASFLSHKFWLLPYSSIVSLLTFLSFILLLLLQIT